jgi:hypothetical protein
MREVFREDGVSEIVDSMLILAFAVVVFLIVSTIVIRDFTSQNAPSGFVGFSVNSEVVQTGEGRNGLALGQSVLVLNFSYTGKALPVENTTMELFMGSQVFYVKLADNDFSQSYQWYPAGPVESGKYVLFNSSLSGAIPHNIKFNTSGLGFAFLSLGKLIWSNEVFYSVPVIAGLVSNPRYILPNESLAFVFYIYSSYEVIQNKVTYETIDSSNGTVINQGYAFPVNVTSSNEWYFPSQGGNPFSLPYKGSYYVTITVYYHPPYSSETYVSDSFSVVVE